MSAQKPHVIHIDGQSEKRGLIEIFSGQEQLTSHVPVNIGISNDLKCVVYSVGPVDCLPHSYVRLAFQAQLINRLKFPVDVGRMVVRSSSPTRKTGATVLPPTDSNVTPEMGSLVISHSGIDLFPAGGGMKNQYYNLVVWASSPDARKADVLQMPEENSEFFLEHFVGHSVAT